MIVYVLIFMLIYLNQIYYQFCSTFFYYKLIFWTSAAKFGSVYVLMPSWSFCYLVKFFAGFILVTYPKPIVLPSSLRVNLPRLGIKSNFYKQTELLG